MLALRDFMWRRTRASPGPLCRLWPGAAAPQAIECIYGWGQQHGTMRKTKHRGAARIGAGFLLNLIAYNIVRIPKLIAA
jgi:hypothetical protein